MIKVLVEFKSGKVDMLEIQLRDYTANLVRLVETGELASIRILY